MKKVNVEELRKDFFKVKFSLALDGDKKSAESAVPGKALELEEEQSANLRERLEVKAEEGEPVFFSTGEEGLSKMTAEERKEFDGAYFVFDPVAGTLLLQEGANTFLLQRICEEFLKMFAEKLAKKTVSLSQEEWKTAYSLLYRLCEVVYVGNGSCLKEMTAEEIAFLEKMLADAPALIGSGTDKDGKPVPASLVFDRSLSSPALFFNRHFVEEWTIAKEIATIAGTVTKKISKEQEEAIDYRSERTFELREEQKNAVRAILKNRLTVVRGGPGTGKTTLLLRALICLKLENSSAKIALAAPTGKAAARMKESLSAQNYDGNGKEFLDEIRDLQPTTVHRLLGLNYSNVEPKALEGVDVLIVDEFSMVSQDLAAKIFKAARGNANLRLVFLGDENQLDSVEAGHVLGELSRVDDLLPEPKLVESNRFGSDKFVGRLSKALLEGDGDAFEKLLNDESGREKYCEIFEFGEKEQRSAAKLEEYLKKIVPEKLQHPELYSPEEILESAESFKVLTPTHNGNMGDESLNRLCCKICRGNADEESRCFHGEPIILMQKSRDFNLEKGETGVIVRDEERESFVALFKGAHGVCRKLSLNVLPEWQTAYAITIHKSQGSEYSRLAVFVPADCHPKLLNRQLLYTAITRFKESGGDCRFSLCYDAKRLEKCRVVKESFATFLAERIRRFFS
ncbi:MAG: AAA family ATPase [Opitutales bacterium]|nr:AAA family ATPase [Opitutales bacterium]